MTSIIITGTVMAGGGDRNVGDLRRYLNFGGRKKAYTHFRAHKDTRHEGRYPGKKQLKLFPLPPTLCPRFHLSINAALDAADRRYPHVFVVYPLRRRRCRSHFRRFSRFFSLYPYMAPYRYARRVRAVEFCTTVGR